MYKSAATVRKHRLADTRLDGSLRDVPADMVTIEVHESQVFWGLQVRASRIQMRSRTILGTKVGGC